MKVIENKICPGWELETEEFTHDKIKRTFNYKNSWLKIFGKEIFISLSLATQIHRSKESLDFYQPHMEVQIIMEVGLTFHTIEQLI